MIYALVMNVMAFVIATLSWLEGNKAAFSIWCATTVLIGVMMSLHRSRA